MQNDAYGSTTSPAGSSYPDHFVIGDSYTNAYERSANLTDIRLYVPAADTASRRAPPPRAAVCKEQAMLPY